MIQRKNNGETKLEFMNK